MTKREKELTVKEKEWAKEKELQEREYKIKEEKRKLKSKYRQKFSTSKLLIVFLFLNCTFIEIFTGWVTVKSLKLATLTGLTPDFAPLITLIGAVVSEVIGFAIYALKSAKENTAGGIVFEQAMAELNVPLNESKESFENID